MPDTVARTEVPSYTRYPVAPDTAGQDSAIDDAVTVPTCGAPGAAGVPGVPPPGPSSTTSSA